MSKSYIHKWDHFFESSVELLLNNPFKTRLTMKYKNKNNIAILKVTDNSTVYMYKATEENDLKKIDALFKVAAQILSNVEEEESVNTVRDVHEHNKKKGKKRG